jgi:transposase-like protein
MPVNSFKWKHFAGEIILQTIRWYLKYSLSYRNLEKMMPERGVEVDHTTIMVPLQKWFRCKNNFCVL